MYLFLLFAAVASALAQSPQEYYEARLTEFLKLHEARRQHLIRWSPDLNMDEIANELKDTTSLNVERIAERLAEATPLQRAREIQRLELQIQWRHFEPAIFLDGQFVRTNEFLGSPDEPGPLK